MTLSTNSSFRLLLSKTRRAGSIVEVQTGPLKNEAPKPIRPNRVPGRAQRRRSPEYLYTRKSVPTP